MRREVMPRQESPRLLEVRRRRRRSGDSRGERSLPGDGGGDEGAGAGAGGAGWVRALRFFLLLKDGMAAAKRQGQELESKEGWTCMYCGLSRVRPA